MTFSEVKSEELTNSLEQAFTEIADKTASGYFDLNKLFFGILATVSLIIVFNLLKYLKKSTFNLVQAFNEKYIKSIKIKEMEFISSRTISKLLNFAINLIYILILITLLYTYVTYIFSLLPITQGIANALIDYVFYLISTLWKAFIGFLPNVISIVFIGFITFYILKFLDFITLGLYLDRIQVKGFHKEWIHPTYQIAKFFIVVFAFIMALPHVPGFESPSFKAVSVFIGVLVTLGSTSAVANIIAGVVLVYMRPFKVGDRVKVGEYVGDILEMSLLVTRIKTIKNVDVTLPNSKVLGDAMMNYSSSTSKNKKLILSTTVTIGYDVPEEKVEELLLAALEGVDGIEQESQPFVLLTSLDNHFISYELNAYSNQPEDMRIIYSQINKNILKQFNEAGIEIMSPSFASIRDGNRMVLPEEFLAKDYQSPAFKVSEG